MIPPPEHIARQAETQVPREQLVAGLKQVYLILAPRDQMKTFEQRNREALNLVAELLGYPVPGLPKAQVEGVSPYSGVNEPMPSIPGPDFRPPERKAQDDEFLADMLNPWNMDVRRLAHKCQRLENVVGRLVSVVALDPNDKRVLWDMLHLD